MSLGHTLFVAKVGKRDQDAIDAILVLLEQFGAFLRIGPGLDRAQLVVSSSTMTVSIPNCSSFSRICLPSFDDQGIGEEVAIADDDAKGGFCLLHG